MQRQGARSAPILAYKFPGFTCISLNDEAAHGIPGERVIQAGDLVNVDVSAELEGYWADTAATMIVPPARPQAERLCRFTRRALDEAIGVVRAGRPLNTIGKTVERIARKGGYAIIRELPGHGGGACTRSQACSTSTPRDAPSCTRGWSSPSSHSQRGQRAHFRQTADAAHCRPQPDGITKHRSSSLQEASERRCSHHLCSA